ncbi:MAG: transcriptional repressor [Verrucomicrobia bacterium]|jgi:Fur family peroxide stress response transcriptional regulator|nr:transcriptional repressor [Verrucomicrobiota bacterium]OQC64096.1 MAG: Peroxide-responsive repressor PerR [Verrucomicrobia bacterium ADurb.Bin006]NMD19761.1 transcriptional repressor [Verrucomicrobiota bacterium]HOA61978.1 Fur family transcriptional regulator [Verrucomicrobiota bacterium]HOF48739.1 Fur family transcriptional regulator [Verrucomicrobiota bacterium]
MKKPVSIDDAGERLSEQLARTGRRLTAQRRQVYNVLLLKRDHPSAEEVFMRAKSAMPDISMATVYNCLETLVTCGLVRQVNHDRKATRYCSNMQHHHHFYCDGCGGAFDIDPGGAGGQLRLEMPPGFRVRNFEILFRGYCPECAAKRKQGAPVTIHDASQTSCRSHRRPLIS